MNTYKLYLISFLLPLIPETRGFSLKRKLYAFAGVILGENVRICSSVKIRGHGIVQIGDNTWIGHNVQIISSSKVVIGKNVDIAPSVYIGTGTHKIDVNGDRAAGEGYSAEVLIDKGTWICTGALILPGTIIKEMCVVAAGAVTSTTFEAFSLIGGVPAKLIKSLKS
ncbi:galactoside O-acetyltransferase-like protein [Winogradskyella psychrotolerans RS-3]|uniref:Galactoside O-acetyltransferase-like protein n=1 Tax=Winogradskyella psychrotolerans RS-3 TaxID=641526 RepID=S7X6S6_9FLAO|nr:acyltransferase [Winogradskyella psychrotolerans]EPR74764.1 galactoside O-acetyltransferase-like protein [Winogradskyella psychrotolerans RS-3]